MTPYDLAKKYGCDSAKYMMDWNDTRVFEGIVNEFLFDGLPLFILETGHGTRLATEEETHNIIQHYMKTG